MRIPFAQRGDFCFSFVFYLCSSGWLWRIRFSPEPEEENLLEAAATVLAGLIKRIPV